MREFNEFEDKSERQRERESIEEFVEETHSKWRKFELIRLKQRTGRK